MVRATTSFETKRFELKSVEGGWIELRPMSYGDFLARRDMGMRMGMTTAGRRDQKIDVDVIQKEVTRFEFSKCIADHNLEDESGRKLSLGEEFDFARLDPKIGEEISLLIDSVIQWTDPKSDGELSTGNGSTDSVSGHSDADD